jgi:hypothetical protein
MSGSLLDLGRVGPGCSLDLLDRGAGKILLGVLGVNLITIARMDGCRVDTHARSTTVTSYPRPAR